LKQGRTGESQLNIFSTLIVFSALAATSFAQAAANETNVSTIHESTCFEISQTVIDNQQQPSGKKTFNSTLVFRKTIGSQFTISVLPRTVAAAFGIDKNRVMRNGELSLVPTRTSLDAVSEKTRLVDGKQMHDDVKVSMTPHQLVMQGKRTYSGGNGRIFKLTCTFKNKIDLLKLSEALSSNNVRW
jgi:hypothetical protein